MNAFDLVLLLLLILFVAIGAWRGFVRELTSFVTWIGAAIVAWVFAADLAAHITFAASDEALRQLLAFAAIFVAAYIAGMLGGRALHRFVSRSAGLRTANSVVGGALGFARGAAIVVIVFLLAGLTAFPQRPWWREATLAPTFERAAVFAARYLPADVARHLRYG